MRPSRGPRAAQETPKDLQNAMQKSDKKNRKMHAELAKIGEPRIYGELLDSTIIKIRFESMALGEASVLLPMMNSPEPPDDISLTGASDRESQKGGGRTRLWKSTHPLHTRSSLGSDKEY